MNFGAILRQAIASGQFRRVVQISREFMDVKRRDRALADLNARGGISGPRVSQGQRGDFTNEAFMSDPDFAFNQRYVDPFGGNEREFYGVLPDGRRMTLNPRTGARSTSAPWQESMVASPYEGMRVWPHLPYDTVPGPWMGRGFPPAYHDFAAGQGPESVVYPSASWEIHNFNVPRAFGGMYDGWLG